MKNDHDTNVYNFSSLSQSFFETSTVHATVTIVKRDEKKLTEITIKIVAVYKTPITHDDSWYIPLPWIHQSPRKETSHCLHRVLLLDDDDQLWRLADSLFRFL